MSIDESATRRGSTLELLLGSLTAFGPLSIDMYLPAFPSIARDLHASAGAVQLTLSSFFAGLAVGQLAAGPLLDRFGRTRPLYVGLVLYILGSIGCAFAPSVNALIGCAFAPSVNALIGWRALQAAGGASPTSPGRPSSSSPCTASRRSISAGSSG